MNSKTPKPYISYSQLHLFEEDRDRYIEAYFKGNKSLENEYMALGKRVSEMLEKRTKTKNKTFEHVKVFIPKFKKHEFKIDTIVNGVPTLAILDGYDPKTHRIDEVKTGTKWTQAMVDKSDQLTFYAMSVYFKSKQKIVPKEIWLHWFETGRDENGELVLTGSVRTFKTTRNIVDFMRMSKRVSSVWKQIQKEYKKFNSKK